MSLRFLGLIWLVLWAAGTSLLAKPALYIIGDSTVRNGTAGQRGWGDPLVTRFDPEKIQVVNRAIGGRSSRTFFTEGRWDAVMAHLQPGDFVLMQFGHNDGGPLNGEKARASLKGTGPETEDIVRTSDGKPETVRTYGWYLANYIAGAREKGATPIVVSQIPRNIWKDGRIGRAGRDYGGWAKQVAAWEDALFIDFNALLADRYEEIGPERTAALFCGTDHTHTAPAGAEFNADVMAAAIRALPGCALGEALRPADLWLPGVFADHMVLQRDRPIPIWGTATAGAQVMATLAGKSATTTADADGKWRLELPAMAAGGPFKLGVTAGAARREFADVLLGEVWLCSGQSNMDFTLARTAKRSFAGVTDWEKVVAAADHPQLRTFSAEWTMNEFPQPDVPGDWLVCTPQTAGDFSAVGYFFARELQEALQVPVGLVTCAYGASTIEAWISRDTLAARPQFKGMLKSFDKRYIAYRDNAKLDLEHAIALSKAGGGRPPKDPDPFQDQHNPAVLHNGMLAPVAPYAIRGVIWYQGESNLPNRDLYADLQETFIGELRELWENPELPFYFVQLAAYKQPSEASGRSELAEMREQQAAALALPHTGMAVAIDAGDAKDIHPRDKATIGQRLARLALAGTYGRPVAASGPMFRSATVQGGKIELEFDHAASGLVARGGPLRHFAIAGADGHFVRAEAVIEGDKVLVSSPEVPQPEQVRYAWADNPEGANLYNQDGLPAAPFRTAR